MMNLVAVDWPGRVQYTCLLRCIVPIPAYLLPFHYIQLKVDIFATSAIAIYKALKHISSYIYMIPSISWTCENLFQRETSPKTGQNGLTYISFPSQNLKSHLKIRKFLE